MMQGVTVVLLLITAPLAGAVGGPWHPGWGFASGFLPPQPKALQSYLLNKSIVGYFVANNTGLASPNELAAEVQLGIVGIGWNLNHLATSAAGIEGGGLEDYEIQQAAALKKARPDVSVMVLRNTEVISTFWSSFRKAVNETDLWLQSPPGSGKPIAEEWGTDDPKSGPPTLKYFLNFSNPRTRQWWLDEYVAPVLDQTNIDGVYTDCSCGTAKGETFTQAEAIGRQQAFDAALALAESKGKWFSSWTINAAQAPTQANCAATMKQAMTRGADARQTLQWLLAQRSGHSFTISKNSIAAFLIARGPSAVIALPAYDAPVLARPFKLEDVDPNADPGIPLGPAKVNGSRFTRSYTKADVMLDCSTFTSKIEFKQTDLWLHV